MVVAVISPHAHNNGNTMTSILTALGLAELKKTVLLTHTSARSDSFYQYLGLNSYEDKTSTPTQLVKLMREGAIKPEEIGDYCKSLMENCDVFTNNLKSFSEDDMFVLMNFLTSDSHYEYMIVDVDEDDLTKEIPALVLERADIIILNMSQSFLEIDRFKKMKEKMLKTFSGKKIMLVCNMWNNTVCKEKDFKSRFGEKVALNVIHFNHWLRYACNTGNIMMVYKKVRQKDARVVELGSDIAKLASNLNKLRLAILRTKKDGGTTK